MKSKILRKSLSIEQSKKNLHGSDFNLPQYLQVHSSAGSNEKHQGQNDINALRKMPSTASALKKFILISLKYAIWPVLSPILFCLRHYFSDSIMQKLHTISDQNHDIIKAITELEEKNRGLHLLLQNEIASISAQISRKVAIDKLAEKNLDSLIANTREI